MNIERVRRLLRQREDIRLEFKEAKAELPETLFETICAMLNRDGGDILLGVVEISKLLTQIGRVDELGSGVLNVNKYLPEA